MGSEESYDVWDRITSSALTLTDGETTNTVYTVAYTYLASANSMTDFIGSESFSNGSAFSYTYDANSNLTSVKENGILKISYTYDSNNQLIREDNAYSGKTTVWTYDANGNILSGKTYAYTTGTVGTLSEAVAYAYGNSSCADLLTSYNGGTITYDAAFLPQNWRNASSLSWEGRNLTSLTLIDGPTITYAYDGNGIRTSKSVGTDTVQYVRDGSKLLQEIHSDYTITFLYDDIDTLIGFRYGGNNYYYGADSLGVIHYVYNEAGTVVVTYTYDAWGNTVSATGDSTLIAVNPIRYKSYYYDSETGFFYLQSRYYDPQVGRFVSADEVDYLGASGTVLGCNLFAYCENNPVNGDDPTGCGPFLAIGVQFAVRIGRFTVGIEALWSTSNWNFYLFGFIGGAKDLNVNLISGYVERRLFIMIKRIAALLITAIVLLGAVSCEKKQIPVIDGESQTGGFLCNKSS